MSTAGKSTLDVERRAARTAQPGTTSIAAWILVLIALSTTGLPGQEPEVDE